MNKHSKIVVFGAAGMVGSAIVRQLHRNGHLNVYSVVKSEFDLRKQSDVERVFELTNPEYIFLAAAKVGGIHANDTYRAEFIYDNLMIECNVIEAAHRFGVKKLLFLGSSCIYPKAYTRPLVEEDLLSGYLEPTNEPYAIAKIAGIKLCEAYRDQYGCNFISVMPCNLYGQGDRYGVNSTHVVPSLIRRFHEAKVNDLPQVYVWGSGAPFREFMYSDDMADSCLFLMNNYDGKMFVNSGTGEEVTIKDLALMIKDIVGFQGDIFFDATKPDGTLRKLMDITRLREMGWSHKVSIREGLHLAYRFFLEESNKK